MILCIYSDASDGYCGLTYEKWFRTKSKLQNGPQGDHTNTTRKYGHTNHSLVTIL